jgi:enamine deaminase RidA (YjgF/YER057c/UK114 family)
MERRAMNPGTWQDQLDFSQGIEVRGAERVIWCAGQTSCDENGAALHPGDMVAQFHQALDNLEKVLGMSDLKLADIVRLNYYVTDVPAFLAATPIVGERLKAAGCKPASTLLGVARLAEEEWLIEIEATAVG